MGGEEGEEGRWEDVKVLESRGFWVRSRKERFGKVERRVFTCMCVRRGGEGGGGGVIHEGITFNTQLPLPLPLIRTCRCRSTFTYSPPIFLET